MTMTWRRPAVIDAVALAALILVGMSAFADTFDGWDYLIACVAGVGAGLAAAVVTQRVRWPWWVLPAPLVVAALVVGPPATLRAAPSGPWPGLGSSQALWRLLLHGWKDLLTTLPPLDGAGRLSAVPFFLCLLGGGVGYLVARRSWRPFLPVVVPVVVAVAAMLLGVASPLGIVVRAVALLALAVVWGSERRRRTLVSSPGGGRRRALTGLGLLAATATVLAVTGPVVASPPTARTVLRERVVAPVDLSEHPSPLAMFRRFRPVSADLADTVLFTVTGLPTGTPVRMATVDRYAGSVWAAGSGVRADGIPHGSGFLRVGARIPVTRPGQAVTARFTVGSAYAAVPDLRVWLPDVGQVTRIDFDGPTAAARDEDLRYNPTTGAALVIDGLAAGDSYQVDAVLPTVVVPTRPGAIGAPTAGPESVGLAAAYLALAAPAGSSPIEQVRAVAARLKATGAYTDGAGEEASFVPGHSVGRLSQFLAEQTPAGNDEQYAAALAVCAAYSGLPSRVVLGAIPGVDGVVRGRDVRAWVEVEVDAGVWWTIAPDDFIPPRDKRPTPKQPTADNNAEAAVVPPPNALRPPSSLEGFALDDSSSGRTREEVEAQRWVWPPWVIVAVKVAATPLAAVLAWTALLVGAKAARRATRRRTGPPSQRVVAGWDEVIDTLRDSGTPVSVRQTRSEVARRAPGLGLREVAEQIDRLGYGPVEPTEADAIDVWAQVGRVRAQLAARLGWRDRWRSAVSLQSAREGRPVDLLAPSVVHSTRTSHGVGGASGSTLAAPTPATAGTPPR